MNIFDRYCIPFAAAALLFAGCSPPQHSSQAIRPDTKPGVADLSKDEVISIASESAEKTGVNLQDFKEPEVQLDFSNNRKLWLLFYERRTGIVGNDFWMTVNDKTRMARFFHLGH